MYKSFFKKPRQLRVFQAPKSGTEFSRLYSSLSDPINRIRNSYEVLLNKTSTESTSCNFITQVVDHWANDSSALGLRILEPEKREARDISYQKLYRYGQQVANYFRAQGFGRGDSVALMLGQHPGWWFSLTGLMRAGIGVVPCPRLLTASDLQYRINDLGIRGIVAADEVAPHVDAIRTQCPSLQLSITTGASRENWHSLASIFAKSSSGKRASDTTNADPCLYLYTSGTTGQPKAVQHNADYPFVHWATGIRWMQAKPGDLVYNASDTGWGFTAWTTFGTWAAGAQLLITPGTGKFNPATMLETLREQGVNIFCAAPTVLRLLVADPSFNDINLPELRRIVTVGEALDETVIQQFANKGVEIAVGFGQAETPLIIGRVDEQTHVPGTMGQEISPYKITILNEEYQPVGIGHTGQIAVDLQQGASAGIIRTYVNDPEKTVKSRSPNRRYHLTGDYATKREDGCFVYHGRRDDLIKSRGYRIGPDEVEKAGMSHPAVAKIAVIGIRTDSSSAAITVKAYILLKPKYSASAELIKEIQQHIKKATGPYKYPRIVEFMAPSEWEKYETTSGKIRRAGLRARDEEQLERTCSNQVSSPHRHRF